jgi:hypothetical protein
MLIGADVALGEMFEVLAAAWLATAVLMLRMLSPVVAGADTERGRFASRWLGDGDERTESWGEERYSGETAAGEEGDRGGAVMSL